jgi:hypothetical protein
MRKNIKASPAYKFVVVLNTLLVMVMCLLLFPVNIIAGSGLTVTGSTLVKDVIPGQKITHLIQLEIGSDDSSTEMTIVVTPIGQSIDGIFTSSEAASVGSQYLATSFISLDKNSVRVEPGSKSEVIATVSIPSNIGDGGKYALINIKTKPTGEGSVGIVKAVNIPVFLTVKNSNLIHTGEITNITTGETISGNPVDILTTLKNTGNHHYKVKGEVEVSDSNGKLMDTIYTSLTSSIIPTMSRQLKATFIPENELTLGVYNIKSKVTLEDGTLLDEGTGSFEVKTPYVPPPAPVSATVKPSLASILKTDDGRITIDFPAGAVLGEAQLALSSYPPEQLPSMPAGYAAGTTAFRVDGLNGLLAKPASVEVKYSTSDLSKAEGDASRLVLARWDEAGSQWTLLKTNLDSATQTLSTETNQFSIWAVLISPSTVASPAVSTVAVTSPVVSSPAAAASGGINWMVAAGVILLVIIIGVSLTYFVFLKSKKLKK